jgi:hypothetical protein
MLSDDERELLQKACRACVEGRQTWQASSSRRRSVDILNVTAGIAYELQPVSETVS